MKKKLERTETLRRAEQVKIKELRREIEMTKERAEAEALAKEEAAAAVNRLERENEMLKRMLLASGHFDSANATTITSTTTQYQGPTSSSSSSSQTSTTSSASAASTSSDSEALPSTTATTRQQQAKPRHQSKTIDAGNLALDRVGTDLGSLKSVFKGNRGALLYLLDLAPESFDLFSRLCAGYATVPMVPTKKMLERHIQTDAGIQRFLIAKADVIHQHHAALVAARTKVCGRYILIYPICCAQTLFCSGPLCRCRGKYLGVSR